MSAIRELEEAQRQRSAHGAMYMATQYMQPCGCPDNTCRWAYNCPRGMSLGNFGGLTNPFAGLARAILFNEPPPKPHYRVKAGREIIA